MRIKVCSNYSRWVYLLAFLLVVFFGFEASLKFTFYSQVETIRTYAAPENGQGRDLQSAISATKRDLLITTEDVLTGSHLVGGNAQESNESKSDPWSKEPLKQPAQLPDTSQEWKPAGQKSPSAPQQPRKWGYLQTLYSFFGYGNGARDVSVASTNRSSASFSMSPSTSSLTTLNVSSSSSSSSSHPLSSPDNVSSTPTTSVISTADALEDAAIAKNASNNITLYNVWLSSTFNGSLAPICPETPPNLVGLVTVDKSRKVFVELRA